MTATSVVLDQVDLAGAGGEGGLAHGPLLDLGDPRGDRDDDAGPEQAAAVVSPPDEVAEHRLGDVEVGNDAVLQRPDGPDRPGGPPEHLLRLLADGADLVDPAGIRLHGDDRGLVRHDPSSLGVYERVGGPEIDREIVREHAEKTVEQHADSRYAASLRGCAGRFGRGPKATPRLRILGTLRLPFKTEGCLRRRTGPRSLPPSGSSDA